MRDAKGHGSDPRGGQKAVASYRADHPALPAPAAHQSGVMNALGKYGPWVVKNGAKLYVAQAAAGAAVGFAYPFLKLAGVVP